MEHIYNPINLEWPESVSYQIGHIIWAQDKMINDGKAKIEKCIESCTNGCHVSGCLNMINSFSKIVKRIQPQNYIEIKVDLLQKSVKKSQELINNLL